MSVNFYENEVSFNVPFDELNSLVNIIEEVLNKRSFENSKYDLISKKTNFAGIELIFKENKTGKEIFNIVSNALLNTDENPELRKSTTLPKSIVTFNLSNRNDYVFARIKMDPGNAIKFNDFIKRINKKIESKYDNLKSNDNVENKTTISDVSSESGERKKETYNTNYYKKIKRMKLFKVLGIIGIPIFVLAMGYSASMVSGEIESALLTLLFFYLAALCVFAVVFCSIRIRVFNNKINEKQNIETKKENENVKAKYENYSLLELCNLLYEEVKNFQNNPSKNKLKELQIISQFIDSKIDELNISIRMNFQGKFFEIQTALTACETLVQMSSDTNSQNLNAQMVLVKKNLTLIISDLQNNNL